MKKIVRLTESDLVRLVKRVIKEQEEDEFSTYMEDLAEYSNKIEFEGFRPKGEEQEWVIGKIIKIVRNAKRNNTLTDDEISQIEEFADDIISKLY
jgi:predicted SprT family Zn-dependent metalloprotease